VVRTCYRTASKFIEAAERYAHLGDTGEQQQIELTQALMIDALCQRYSCLPSQLLEEDASILRLVRLVQVAEQNNG
jgi:hypothetical protein